jgi:hypothetical protein
VSTAFTGSPCGGPKSPLSEPPVSVGALVVVEDCWPQATSSRAAAIEIQFFMLCISGGFRLRIFCRCGRRATLIQISRSVDKH